MTIEYAWAGRALGEPGEGAESGDLHVIAPSQEGALAAVIDGLGHGTEAALAARAAAEVLCERASEGLNFLLQQCHIALARTRGAVMSLAYFDSRTASMTWAGVGNVEGLLIREQATSSSAKESLPLRGGVVGYQVPQVRPTVVAVFPGDTLIMVTDGIHSSFTDGVDVHDTPRNVADSILARHARKSDDALVLVVRYVGRALQQEATQGMQESDPYDPIANIEGLESFEHSVPIREEVDVVIARMSARDLAIRNGLSAAAAAALATATSEVGRNIILHATGGEILLGTLREAVRRGVVVVARDHGPGIFDVALAIQDGYSSARGLGLGLSSARRLADGFHLVTAPGKGTTVTLKKWAPF